MLAMSLIDETDTAMAPPVGEPVDRVSNLHTFWVLSHAMVVVEMTKVPAAALIATVPVRPVPPVQAMVGGEEPEKKPGGQLTVIAFDATGTPDGSENATVTA